MGWILLLSGITINLTGVLSIKYAQHITPSPYSFIGYLAYFIGFVIISLSFKYLDMSLAYATWSGLGSLLILAFGVFFFKESLSAPKLIFFSLIMIGVIGVTLTT